MSKREIGMGITAVLPAGEIIEELVRLLPEAMSRVMPISNDMGGDQAWADYVVIRIMDSMSELNAYVDYSLMKTMAEHLKIDIEAFLPARSIRAPRTKIIDPIALQLCEMGKTAVTNWLLSFGEFVSEYVTANHDVGGQVTSVRPKMMFMRKGSAIYLLPAQIVFPETDLVIDANKIENPPRPKPPKKEPGHNVITFPKKKAKPKPPPRKPK